MNKVKKNICIDQIRSKTKPQSTISIFICLNHSKFYAFSFKLFNLLEGTIQFIESLLTYAFNK